MSLECVRCDKPATLRCGGCADALYCSTECQARHWSVEGHRDECAQAVGDRLDEAATERIRDLLRDTDRLLAAHDADALANFLRDAGRRTVDARLYAAWKQTIVRVVDTKRPGGVRWQMQTPLVGRSLLTVFSTARYDPVLQLAVDPVRGLSAAWRRPRAAPLRLPDCMQGPRGMEAVNALLDYVYAFHHQRPGLALAPVLQAENLDADKLQAFVAHVSANWGAYNMPEPRMLVRLVQPDAQPGDVLIWDSFHGSAAVAGPPSPHLVMFHDFVPRDTLDETTREAMFRVQSVRAFEYGSGSKATRSEAWNDRYNEHEGSVPGGLARMGKPAPLLAQYLAGNDDYDAAVRALALPAVLGADDMRQLQNNGYLVVPRARLDAATGGAWGLDVAAVIGQVEDYMNWALWDGQEDAAAAPFRLDNAADPRWAVLSGSGDAAQRHMGDPLWLRVFLADGRTKSGTAQGGGTRLAGDSGMGPALNAYDLPAQQALRTSPALFALAAALYGTRRLMAVPERFRLKTAAKLFAVHTDRLVTLLPDAAVAAPAAARVGMPADGDAAARQFRLTRGVWIQSKAGRWIQPGDDAIFIDANGAAMRPDDVPRLVAERLALLTPRDEFAVHLFFAGRFDGDTAVAVYGLLDQRGNVRVARVGPLAALGSYTLRSLPVPVSDLSPIVVVE